MINQEQINELLKKSKEIEEKITNARAEYEKLEKDLLVTNTQKSELLKKLAELGVTEENLLDKIQEKYEKIQNGIAKFEGLTK